MNTEFLGNNTYCFVSKEHTFGTDALLLAYFASPKRKDKCCDLGTGCGIIPLLWFRDGVGDITGVDIQQKAIEQLKESVKLSGAGGQINAVNVDLKLLKGILPFGSYNLVTMNPPYNSIGRGIESRSDSDKLARHENACTFSDICLTASKLLTFGGRLCMCIKPERLFELMKVMSENRLEPKRLRLVAKCPGKAPWLALVEAKLGSKSGMVVEPTFYIYENNGNYTEEMIKVYGAYKEQNAPEK